jgi:DNA-binding PadR family transcriptional regulator
MPVKHALLALLAQRDLTGYELKVRFERTLGDFWQLNSGQVYSTLERLRRGGLVTRQRETGSIERSRYTLLPRGRRQLERWIAAPAPRLRPVRDPLYVKLVFTPPERTPALLGSFVAETRRYGDAVETLGALVAREPLSPTGRARWLVAEATRLQYDAQLRWLATVRRVLDGAGATPIAAPEREPIARRGTLRALPPSRNEADGARSRRLRGTQANAVTTTEGTAATPATARR